MSAQIIPFETGLTSADVEAVQELAWPMIASGWLSSVEDDRADTGARYVSISGMKGAIQFDIGKDRQGYYAFDTEGAVLVSGAPSIEAVADALWGLPKALPER